MLAAALLRSLTALASFTLLVINNDDVAVCLFNCTGPLTVVTTQKHALKLLFW